MLGFSNVWYESALHHVGTTSTEEGVLRHLDAPHFCATKLEAFASRADGDYYHHDIEDFIAIVDERTELIDEIAAAPSHLREFLVGTTRQLLQTPAFVEALRGHLSADEVGEQRLPGLRVKLGRIAVLTASDTRPPTSAPPSARPVPPGVARLPAGRRGAPSSPQGLVGGAFTPRRLVSGDASFGARVYLQSSDLNWVEYDAQQQQLLVGFNSGTTYRYWGVPLPVYQGLLDAYSKGRYFHLWIRNRYQYRRVH